MSITKQIDGPKSTWRAYRDLPRPVLLLCLGTLINRAAMFLIPFLTFYLQEALGLSVQVATRAMGAFGLGAIVAALLGGHLADLLGRRVVMLVSLVGGAGIMAIFGSLDTEGAVLTATFSFSLLSEMYRPAASAMIADLVEPARRPHAYSLMYVTVNLGFTVGAAVGGVVARYSFQWLFWGDALTSCAYAMIILVAIRETLPTRAHLTATATATSTGTGTSTNTGTGTGDPESGGAVATVGFREAVVHIVRDRVFLLYCLGTVLTALVFIQIMTSFPLHIRAQGLGPAVYGGIIAINGAMIVLLQLPVAGLITRFDRGRVMAAAAVVTSVSFGMVALATQTWQLVLIIVLVTVGELMSAPLMQSIVGDLASPALRGRYMGMLSLCHSMALLIGAPLGGWVLEHYGGHMMWGGCGIVGLAGAAVYLSIRRGLAVAS